MLQLLQKLQADNLISALNYQFAKMIDSKQQGFGYSDTQKNLAVLLSALVSFNVMQGHSCVRLDSWLTSNPFGLAGKRKTDVLHTELLQKIAHIPPLEWQELLRDHIAFSSDPSQTAPLLFQHQRLYFYRYWQAEHQIANYLKQAVTLPSDNTNWALDRQILDRFFEPTPHIDWQKIAAATALVKPFCLISGGPGTGKTRTVARLLASLQLKQLEQQLPPLNIALAAPTGKAAARLKDSINQNLAQLALPSSLNQSLPTRAFTLHSLLGIVPNNDLPRYHARNPLHLDLLVVDEASMIDLFVMAKLLNALKPSTQLIMLGDKDQLASVEAGNAMTELGGLLPLGYSREYCDYLTATTGYAILPQNPQIPPICDFLCHLRHSFRFDEKSGIGQLAAEINAQQATTSWQIFANTAFDDLQRIEYPSPIDFADKRQWQQQCVALVVEKAVALYQNYLQLVKQRHANPRSTSVSAIFHTFQQVRFLSALRVSELGVEQLNHTIAEALRHARLVQFNNSRESYVGKPILITENAPQLNIFSGDIGIMLPDEQGILRIYFETIENGEHLNISPSRVPNYEPAYVMTVHKSQGSEFAHTLMVMPLNTAPVLTKELLYTAVTRAKQQFTLFGSENVWKQAVKSDIQRQSGLREQLL